MRKGLWRSSTLVLAALALSSCGETWRPVSFVEGMRVLAVRAEPPDLAPGTVARLSSLLIDPSAPNRENTQLWLACDPDARALDQPICAKLATLEDPRQLVTGGELPEGVRIVGFGSAATYDAPADLFAPLAPDDPVRTKGLSAIVLLMAIGAPPPETMDEAALEQMLEGVESGEIASALVIKRIRISEEAALNRNPALASVSFSGETWDPGLRPVKLRPGTRYELTANAADGASELYEQLDADGKRVQKQEPLNVSWFATFGELDQIRTPAGEASQSYTVPWPFDALPSDRRATIYLVLRDGRGGVGWMARGLFVCDPFLEAPTIEAIEPAAAAPASSVTIHGRGLDQMIDVRLGDRWLSEVRFDSARGVLTGIVPSDAPVGPAQLVVRGRSCLPDPSAAFEVLAP